MGLKMALPLRSNYNDLPGNILHISNLHTKCNGIRACLLGFLGHILLLLSIFLKRNIVFLHPEIKRGEIKSYLVNEVHLKLPDSNKV